VKSWIQLLSLSICPWVQAVLAEVLLGLLEAGASELTGACAYFTGRFPAVSHEALGSEDTIALSDIQMGPRLMWAGSMAIATAGLFYHPLSGVEWAADDTIQVFIRFDAPILNVSQTFVVLTGRSDLAL
jgi:hypothetical protein